MNRLCHSMDVADLFLVFVMLLLACGALPLFVSKVRHHVCCRTKSKARSEYCCWRVIIMLVVFGGWWPSSHVSLLLSWLLVWDYRRRGPPPRRRRNTNESTASTASGGDASGTAQDDVVAAAMSRPVPKRRARRGSRAPLPGMAPPPALVSAARTPCLPQPAQLSLHCALFCRSRQRLQLTHNRLVCAPGWCTGR